MVDRWKLSALDLEGHLAFGKQVEETNGLPFHVMYRLTVIGIYMKMNTIWRSSEQILFYRLHTIQQFFFGNRQLFVFYFHILTEVFVAM